MRGINGHCVPSQGQATITPGLGDSRSFLATPLVLPSSRTVHPHYRSQSALVKVEGRSCHSFAERSPGFLPHSEKASPHCDLRGPPGWLPTCLSALIFPLGSAPFVPLQHLPKHQHMCCSLCLEQSSPRESQFGPGLY